MPDIVYLHGFASSPQSRKAQWFRRRFDETGVKIAVPDLENGDFTGLTVSGMIGRVKEASGNGPVTLMGSSLGGYVAALYAWQWPERVDRLILMAPAFNFAGRWVETLGETEAQRWKRTGWLPLMHYGRGVEAKIGWGLIEDAIRYPAEPQPLQPSLVFHGSEDAVVPLEAARRWCETHPERRLVIYEDGHDLGESLEAMWAEMRGFLSLNRA